MKRRFLHYTASLVLFIIAVAGVNLAAQEVSKEAQVDFDLNAQMNQLLQIAMSNPEYPATPGDVYQLTYVAGSVTVSSAVVLDATYILKVHNLGVLDARGKTYLQLKAQVENLVSKNYPLSGVQFSLMSPGLFKILVKGEVTAAVQANANGLTRVGDLLGKATAKGSLRNVQVTSSSGRTVSYDVFSALRTGNLKENPYVKPGDIITILPADRRVSITGEIYRPGTYQLLDDEKIKHLIENYGGGFNLEADPGKIYVTRINTDGTPGESLKTTYKELSTFVFRDGDRVTVANKAANRGYVFFEGAILTGKEKTEAAKADSAGEAAYIDAKSVDRLNYPFYTGELLSSAVRSLQGNFILSADLENAVVIRPGKRIDIDLTKFLYFNDYSSDIKLSDGDIIFIPQRQFSVLIKGEVKTAGKVSASAVTRLSSLLGNVTDRASLRDVEVRSADGVVKVYDLFKAKRTGDMSQDPYVMNNDEITVKTAERRIILAGEVNRSGEYQLLSGENITALIEQYGDGFTFDADPLQIYITRRNTGTDSPGESLKTTYKDLLSFEFRDGDRVTVANKAANRGYVFFEGAILTGKEKAEAAKADNAGEAAYIDAKSVDRLNYPFYSGELLSSAVRALQGNFILSADLANAVVIRPGKRINIDLTKFLYFNDYSADLTLTDGDVIFVPQRQFSVLIKGEVKAAGKVSASAVTRLSSLLGNVTDRASLRDIEVKSADGVVKVYDLFKAKRTGDMSQDPYVMNDDEITVKTAQCRIILAGEVNRSGEYQLLSGENITALIEQYGDGFTFDADPLQIYITRRNTGTDSPGESLKTTYKDLLTFVFRDGDRVTVANKAANRGYVFFEGAILTGKEKAEAAKAQETGETAALDAKSVDRLNYPFYSGELLSSAVRALQGSMTLDADIENAVLVRSGTRKTVDLSKFLYFNDYTGDFELKVGDIFFIPYRKYSVLLKGEVKTAGLVPANALTRLSSLLGNVTEKASLRDIEIKSLDGHVQICDMYKAKRYGDLTNDPYVRHGDVITIKTAPRRVTLSGAVYRPGSYQMLPDELSSVLINEYGDGFKYNADQSLLYITRVNTEPGIPGRTFSMNYDEFCSFALFDGDIVTINDQADKRKVVFFEGAIKDTDSLETKENTGIVVEGSGKVNYRFYEGAKLSSAVRGLSGQFLMSSDISKSYVLRRGVKIPVNFEDFLYRNDFSKDMILENGDNIIIPFRQYFVIVSGSVKNPGKYAYVPDRDYQYYVDIAGGIDETANNGLGIRVRDLNGNKLSVKENIPAEALIHVPANRFIYFVNQYMSIVTLIVSIISLVIAIIPYI